MFKWKKIGLIFDPTKLNPRLPWRWNYAQGQNVLIYDKFVRVYCCCREKPNELGQTVSRIMYVDLDRSNLTKVIKVSEKPIIDLGKTGDFDEYGMYPFSVVKHKNKIYGYYGGITRCESVPFNAAIGCVISNDHGETFERIGRGPILSYSLHEPFIIGSPKVRIFNNKWYMTYSAGVEWTEGKSRPEIYYKLKMAISDDGINWKKCNYRLIEDKLEETEAQACGDIIYRNGLYHMFFCYRCNQDFRHNINNSYRIGYAYSKDLIKWKRCDEKAGIDISNNKDDWDSEMVAYPNVFELDNKIYMLYLGNGVGQNGFGLAELEGDL